MIVDTSAIIAILRDEPDAPQFENCLASAIAPPKISAANLLEAGIVADGMNSAKISARLDQIVARSGLEIVPVTETQARIARRAYREFGKGSESPAKLNFGDCFAYALSYESGEPLLYKGRDFAHTDIEGAAT